MSLFRRKKKANDEIFIASFNRSNATVTDSELTEVFSEVGSRYGYADVKAKFKALKDFKVQWQRSYKWAEFTVSDYMDRAPYDVLENLADVLFSKINGSDARYGEAFIRYVTDGRIVRDNRNDYLKRSRGLSKTSIGDFHDLDDCVNRLRDEGLISDDLECVLKWDHSLSNKAAGCSVLQRVVTVNKSLDQKGVPEHVLDYCVYSMMCYVIIGFDPQGDVEYEHQRLVSRHPMESDAIAWLNGHGMYL